MILALWLCVLVAGINAARDFKTVEDYMNVCIKGRYHKASPTPEKGLAHEFCSPWMERSCCTKENAAAMAVDPAWLNFNWHHCGQLSPKCTEYFLKDLCFYECTPNAGPWVVEDIRKIRKERFRDVPMCRRSCTTWWEACKDDLTCLDNWAVKFDWSTGINTCPKGRECKPFHQIYTGADHFCQTVFNNSFTVVDDSEDCLVTWFDGTQGNPNENIARKRAAEILNVPFVPAPGGSNSAGKKMDFGQYMVYLMYTWYNYFMG